MLKDVIITPISSQNLIRYILSPWKLLSIKKKAKLWKLEFFLLIHLINGPSLLIFDKINKQNIESNYYFMRLEIIE